MISITSLENFKQTNEYLSLAIGNFDGVHVGHKKLINETVEDAALHNGVSAIFTFWPHPLRTINKDIPLKLLTSLYTKKIYFENIGINYAFLIPFSNAIRELSPPNFVKHILVDTLHVKSVHVGYNFYFGKNALGNTDDLKKLGLQFGFDVHILPEVKIGCQSVSSTLIKQCIEDGEIELANEYLGYKYKIAGEVISGESRGREIGFPTANIKLEKEVVIPAKGVYVAYAYVNNRKYQAVVSIGSNPTFGLKNLISVEAHLLNFQDDIYGKNLTLTFLKRLREEKRFSSVSLLIAEINNDIISAKNYLNDFK